MLSCGQSGFGAGGGYGGVRDLGVADGTHEGVANGIAPQAEPQLQALLRAGRSLDHRPIRVGMYVDLGLRQLHGIKNGAVGQRDDQAALVVVFHLLDGSAGVALIALIAFIALITLFALEAHLF